MFNMSLTAKALKFLVYAVLIYRPAISQIWHFSYAASRFDTNANNGKRRRSLPPWNAEILQNKTIGFGRFSINQLTTNVPHHIETSQLICNANQLNTVSTMVLSRRLFLEGNYITFFWLWVFVYFVCLPLFFLIVPMSRFELIAKFEIQKVFMKSLVSYILRVQKLFTIKKCHQIKSSTNFGWWLVNTLLT